MKRFEGHGVLITGAARGIGAATARRLASEGARVLVTDIDTDAAEETAASIDGAEPFPSRAWRDRAAEREFLREVYPLGRVGEPENIAAAVAFLASCDAAWITGTTLRVDGGLLAVNSGFERLHAGRAANGRPTPPSART